MAAIDKLRCRYYSDFKDFVVIGSSRFSVEQVIFYPFGDNEGNKGAGIYIQRL